VVTVQRTRMSGQNERQKPSQRVCSIISLKRDMMEESEKHA